MKWTLEAAREDYKKEKSRCCHNCSFLEIIPDAPSCIYGCKVKNKFIDNRETEAKECKYFTEKE